MTALERLFHAILFEFLAIIISIFAVKLTTSHPTTETGIVIVLISVIAVFWNMLFNWIFDKYFPGAREKRRTLLRMFHTLAFEGGLLAFTLPLVAFILKINWLDAFIMDISLTLLIVVYTFFFNLIYDHLRAVMLRQS
ncbi:PACE efflux transporter [Actinobacillus sp. GY-402]|nr:PACE efflux transporter [Actinobacillus sp. GY-402]